MSTVTEVSFYKRFDKIVLAESSDKQRLQMQALVKQCITIGCPDPERYRYPLTERRVQGLHNFMHVAMTQPMGEGKRQFVKKGWFKFIYSLLKPCDTNQISSSTSHLNFSLETSYKSVLKVPRIQQQLIGMMSDLMLPPSDPLEEYSLIFSDIIIQMSLSELKLDSDYFQMILAHPCKEEQEKIIEFEHLNGAAVLAAILLSRYLREGGYSDVLECVETLLPDKRDSLWVTANYFGMRPIIDALRPNPSVNTVEGAMQLVKKHQLPRLDLFRIHDGLNTNTRSNRSCLTQLGELTSLEELAIPNLTNCCNLCDFSFLARLTLLKVLDLKECWSLTNDGIKFMSGLTNLQKLNLAGCSEVYEINPLSTLVMLTHLNFSQTWEVSSSRRGSHLRDIASLSSMTNLQTLKLKRCTFLRVDTLSDFTSLRSLSLTGCDQIDDLTPISTLTSLRSLSLAGCDQIDDLTPISILTKLQWLDLLKCRSLSNETTHHLTNLIDLRSLSLQECSQLTNTSTDRLTCLTKLEYLNLNYCPWVRSIQSLQREGLSVSNARNEGCVVM